MIATLATHIDFFNRRDHDQTFPIQLLKYAEAYAYFATVGALIFLTSLCDYRQAESHSMTSSIILTFLFHLHS